MNSLPVTYTITEELYKDSMLRMKVALDYLRDRSHRLQLFSSASLNKLEFDLLELSQQVLEKAAPYMTRFKQLHGEETTASSFPTLWLISQSESSESLAYRLKEIPLTTIEGCIRPSKLPRKNKALHFDLWLKLLICTNISLATHSPVNLKSIGISEHYAKKLARPLGFIADIDHEGKIATTLNYAHIALINIIMLYAILEDDAQYSRGIAPPRVITKMKAMLSEYDIGSELPKRPDLVSAIAVSRARRESAGFYTCNVDKLVHLTHRELFNSDLISDSNMYKLSFIIDKLLTRHPQGLNYYHKSSTDISATIAL
jgi:hypothetical protein